MSHKFELPPPDEGEPWTEEELDWCEGVIKQLPAEMDLLEKQVQLVSMLLQKREQVF